MRFTLTALTDIWTGDVNRRADRLRPTGIKGSIRWWYEAVVRGLGGYACDPRSQQGCRLSSQTTDPKTEICPVCYLFGCTGWRSKFNLQILSATSDEAVQTKPIQRNEMFSLVLVETKSVDPPEYHLLQTVLRVIVDYGALGGRTTFKPSEIAAKNEKPHHKDLGIVARGANSDVPDQPVRVRKEIEEYLDLFSTNKRNDDMWPDLRNFWFIKGRHLNRLQHNNIVGRTSTGVYSNPSDRSVFLGGFIAQQKQGFPRPTRDLYVDDNAASKKIFSFHGQRSDRGVQRCFGYVRNAEELRLIRSLLIQAIPQLRDDEITTGEVLLDRFLEER